MKYYQKVKRGAFAVTEMLQGSFKIPFINNFLEKPLLGQGNLDSRQQYNFDIAQDMKMALKTQLGIFQTRKLYIFVFAYYSIQNETIFILGNLKQISFIKKAGFIKLKKSAKLHSDILVLGKLFQSHLLFQNSNGN